MKNEIVLGRLGTHVREMARLEGKENVRLYTQLFRAGWYDGSHCNKAYPIKYFEKIAQTWGKDKRWERLKEFVENDRKKTSNIIGEYAVSEESEWHRRAMWDRQILEKMKELEERNG